MVFSTGNELCGSGIGVGIAADQYASDTIVLHDLIEDIYKGVGTKPKIIAPGGFFDAGWFQQYLAKTVGSVHVITHHIYNLGPGIQTDLNPQEMNKFVDIGLLQEVMSTLSIGF